MGFLPLQKVKKSLNLGLSLKICDPPPSKLGTVTVTCSKYQPNTKLVPLLFLNLQLGCFVYAASPISLAQEYNKQTIPR